jgi:photosystem II stability/assembly factor-like uncharacterized protein
VECWASTDDGRLWQRRSAAAPGEPPGNRMNVAAGRDGAGTYFVIASGWTPVLEPGDEGEGFEFQERTVLPALVCRSEDGGHTWERDGDVALPDDAVPPPIPFGDVVAGPGGMLACTMYSWHDRQNNTCWFYVSEDGGRTWAPRAVIGADDYNETDLLHLGSGRWLAACRTVRDAHLALFRSHDDGATWQAAGPLTLPRQHPAHLLRLADGRILLVYGIRNPGLYGVGARLSADDGETWDTPRLLVDFGDATDGGYPSSAQCADGTIVTAYYANRVAAHRRYHMGVIRWRADE